MEKCCEHLELAKCAAQPGIHNAIGFIQQNYCSHRVLFRNDYPFALKRALLSLRFDQTLQTHREAAPACQTTVQA
jgi:hypothetical protein